jgi:hypothetical protein
MDMHVPRPDIHIKCGGLTTLWGKKATVLLDAD